MFRSFISLSYYVHLSRLFISFISVHLFRLFGLGSLVGDLQLGIFGFGSLSWVLGFVSLAWDLWLGIFGLGLGNWDPEAGGSAWR